MKINFEKLVFLNLTFKFPPLVESISVIFQYVIADIILYLLSLRSAQTVKFWPRTSFKSIFNSLQLWERDERTNEQTEQSSIPRAARVEK